MSRKKSTATKLAEAKLAEQPVQGEPPQYHSILKVWRDMLDPEHQLRHLPPTADWCAVLLAKWSFLSFKECGAVQEAYFEIFDMAHEIIEQVYADHPEAFEVDNREDDLENKELYVFLLAEWQKGLFVVQGEWSYDDPDAGAKMAAMGEAQSNILGKQGLASYLNVVGLPFSQEEQAEMDKELAEFRELLGV